MDKQVLAEKAEIFKALGSSVRLGILLGLRKEGCNVKRMQEHLGVRQSTISQHLKILKMAGIISVKQKANTRCYYLNGSKVKKLTELIKKGII